MAPQLLVLLIVSLQHMIKSMDPENGRCAVVLPQGVLFHAGKEGDIREMLIRSDKLEAVITLAKRLYFKSVKTTIDHLGDAVTEFDERLWCNLLDHIVVNDEERVTVIFRDGMEIVVPLGALVKSRTRTASREKTTS